MVCSDVLHLQSSNRHTQAFGVQGQGQTDIQGVEQDVMMPGTECEHIGGTICQVIRVAAGLPVLVAQNAHGGVPCVGLPESGLYGCAAPSG